MWHPNRLQWLVIWSTAFVVIGCQLGNTPAGAVPSLVVGSLLVWQISGMSPEKAKSWANRLLIATGVLAGVFAALLVLDKAWSERTAKRAAAELQAQLSQLANERWQQIIKDCPVTGIMANRTERLGRSRVVLRTQSADYAFVSPPTKDGTVYSSLWMDLPGSIGGHAAISAMEGLGTLFVFRGTAVPEYPVVITRLPRTLAKTAPSSRSR